MVDAKMQIVEGKLKTGCSTTNMDRVTVTTEVKEIEHIMESVIGRDLLFLWLDPHNLFYFTNIYC